MAGFFCDHCGGAVELSAERCPHCGKVFDAVKCPRCQFVGADHQFDNGCPRCGYLAELRSSSKMASRFAPLPPRFRLFLPLMGVIFFLIVVSIMLSIHLISGGR